MFNLAQYIKDRNIDYIEFGANVKKGDINISCPLCGDDPSKHLGINLKTGFWSCWRNQAHCGSRPHRLLSKLFGMSAVQIEELLSDGETATPISTLKDRFKNLTDKEIRHEPYQRRIELPDEFRDDLDAYSASKFVEYVATNYNLGDDVTRFWRKYHLRFCVRGKFKDRVIIPIFFERRLVGWTGRSIYKNAELRYYSFPDGDSIKQIVFNYDQADNEGIALAPGEGPFDTMKLDFYGEALGCRSIGVLGVRITESQINLIDKIAARYDMVINGYDNDSAGRIGMWRLFSHLSRHRRVRTGLNFGASDPGEAAGSRIRDAIIEAIRGRDVPETRAS